MSLILGPIGVRSHYSYGNLRRTKVVREVPRAEKKKRTGVSQVALAWPVGACVDSLLK